MVHRHLGRVGADHRGELGETEFLKRHQCLIRSLAAFEKSEYADDWRELMRLYLVRRTRTFIQDNYAQTDCTCGQQVQATENECPKCGTQKAKTSRRYLTFEDGSRSYFPTRVPKTVKFKITDKNPADQYAPLYADDVVDAINHLSLPRYGLGNYLAPTPHTPPTQSEGKVIQDLSRAGKRLMGVLPDEPLQTPRKQRPSVHPVRRAAYPAQLRLPLRHREGPPHPNRHPGR
jgi:hypothetical protein